MFLSMILKNASLVQKSLNRTTYTTFFNFYFSLGLLRWLDKAVVDYTNWDSNEYYRQSHGSIQTENGKWTTAKMQYNRPYICKTPKGKQSLTE